MPHTQGGPQALRWQWRVLHLAHNAQFDYAWPWRPARAAQALSLLAPGPRHFAQSLETHGRTTYCRDLVLQVAPGRIEGNIAGPERA